MSECIGEGCTHPSHGHGIVVQETKSDPIMNPDTITYRGQECPIVKFNSGPFRNRIYARYKGQLVHVGNRKLVPLKMKD